jgi:translation initiation factor IF-1
MTGRVVAIQADISFNGGQIVTVQCEDGSVRVAHRSFLEIWRP